MKPHRRRGQATYEVDVRWRGYPRTAPRLQHDQQDARRCHVPDARGPPRRGAARSAGSTRSASAEARGCPRYFSLRSPSLEHLKAKAVSPRLGALVERWLVGDVPGYLSGGMVALLRYAVLYGGATGRGAGPARGRRSPIGKTDLDP